MIFDPKESSSNHTSNIPVSSASPILMYLMSWCSCVRSHSHHPRYDVMFVHTLFVLENSCVTSRDWSPSLVTNTNLSSFDSWLFDHSYHPSSYLRCSLAIILRIIFVLIITRYHPSFYLLTLRSLLSSFVLSPLLSTLSSFVLTSRLHHRILSSFVLSSFSSSRAIILRPIFSLFDAIILRLIPLRSMIIYTHPSMRYITPWIYHFDQPSRRLLYSIRRNE